MYAVEFNSKINNGKIEIPSKYLSELNSVVKVIILNADTTIKTEIAEQSGKKDTRSFGILANRANTHLWEKEDGAWERDVVQRYENC